MAVHELQDLLESSNIDDITGGGGREPWLLCRHLDGALHDALRSHRREGIAGGEERGEDGGGVEHG